MPEISEQTGDKKLYICKMTEGLLLLELTFGEINLELEFKIFFRPIFIYSLAITLLKKMLPGRSL